MREALKNVICSTCGGPPINVDCDFDEQKLRIENAQLKEEVRKSLTKYPLMQNICVYSFLFTCRILMVKYSFESYNNIMKSIKAK
jgi:hypothetical protein